MNRIQTNIVDVVSMPAFKSFIGTQTFKLSQFGQVLAGRFDKSDGALLCQWFGEGVECELLQTTGGGWKKGKIRVRFEFVPDEPKLTNEPEPPSEPTPDSSDAVRSPQ